MNATYLSHLFLHQLLILIIHRENCQIFNHSISICSATTPPGPWRPLADASTLLRHLLVSMSDLTTQFSAACSYFLLPTVSYKYFLHNYVIRLNLRSSGTDRPLVRLSTIDDNSGFERWSVVPKMVFLYWFFTAKVSSSTQHCFTICGEVTQLLQLSDSTPTQ